MAHANSLWACLNTMMGISEVACEATAREAASLPLVLGGLGLRSACRTHPSAYWARWDDSFPHGADPGVVVRLFTDLEGVPVGRSLTSATTVARSLDGVHRFEIPSFGARARPPPRDPEDDEPGSPRQGWQHEASSRVEQEFRELAFSEAHGQEEDHVAIAELSRSRRVLVHHSFKSFKHSFVADFASLCQRASAGMAAPSIALATTVQHVLVLGLWLDGDLQWRVPSLALSRRWRPRCHQPDDSRS